MVSMVRHGLGVAIMPRLAVLNIDLAVRPLPTPLTRQLGVLLKVGRAGLPHVQGFSGRWPVSAVRGLPVTAHGPSGSSAALSLMDHGVYGAGAKHSC